MSAIVAFAFLILSVKITTFRNQRTCLSKAGAPSIAVEITDTGNMLLGLRDIVSLARWLDLLCLAFSSQQMYLEPRFVDCCLNLEVRL